MEKAEHSATQGVVWTQLTLDPNLLSAQIKGHASIYPNSTDERERMCVCVCVGGEDQLLGEKHLVAPQNEPCLYWGSHRAAFPASLSYRASKEEFPPFKSSKGNPQGPTIHLKYKQILGAT